MARAVDILFLVIVAALETLAGKPDLYYFPPSPPCRVVMMTAKVLGADLNIKMTDITKGEQMTPEFLKAMGAWSWWRMRNEDMSYISSNMFSLRMRHQLQAHIGFLLEQSYCEAMGSETKHLVILECWDHKHKYIYQINPQHTVPTLDDNGFVLSESRAIAAYLADTTPNGEKIYPKDPKKRAQVEQMLYFDIGRLYQNFLDLYKPMLMSKPFDEARAKTFDDALAMFEEYLTRMEWAAGDQMTIADLSLMSTVTTAEAVGHDLSKFPKIKQWMDKTKTAIPEYQTANQDGVDHWKAMFANIKKS